MRYHLIFSSDTKTCKVYDGQTGYQIFSCPMHDAAVNGPGFGHWGRCPRGTYRLGQPVAHDHPAFGYWFTPVLSVPDRGGIGIHGGGSGLADPFAPQQGWVPTHGCLRVQNEDNAKLVQLIRQGDCQITVSGA